MVAPTGRRSGTGMPTASWRRVAMRRPGWTASVTGPRWSPRSAAAASMSATVRARPQKVAGPGPWSPGRPMSSRTTSPSRKKRCSMRPASRTRRSSTPIDAEGLGGPVQVGGGDHEVVDGRRGVRVARRRGGAGGAAGRHGEQAVDHSVVDPRERPGHDPDRSAASRRPGRAPIRAGCSSVDGEPGGGPGRRGRRSPIRPTSAGASGVIETSSGWAASQSAAPARASTSAGMARYACRWLRSRTRLRA